jgi:hypothetical protein
VKGFGFAGFAPLLLTKELELNLQRGLNLSRCENFKVRDRLGLEWGADHVRAQRSF